MAQLTLSFYDTTRGVAIPGIDVEIQKINKGGWEILAQLNSDINGDIVISDADTNSNLSGYYEATARIGNYFLDAGYVLPTLKFIDVVPIRFGISDPDADASIQIALTPYGYSFLAK